MYEVAIVRGAETREAYAVSECMSVRSWLNMQIGGEFNVPMICMYQGTPLLRDQWEITLICADVTFVPVPLGGGGGGGGKNILAIIGMAVVMVLAVVAQQYWALPATAAAWGISATTATTIGYISAALIMVGGTMLVNAVFPSQPNLPKLDSNTRDLESASPTYSLQISQNQARLYQMIPECFGRNMQIPDLGAQQWWEFIGNEQYVHILLVIGVGYYQIERIGIVDTDVWSHGGYTGNFPEVEVEIVNPGERISLFPDNIETAAEVSGQVLNLETIGPFAANSAGTQTTALAVDVVLSRGLGYMDDKGGISWHSVSVRWDYQAINDHGVPQGDWHELTSRVYSNATHTQLRFTHIINVAPGRYQVRGYCTGGGETNSRLMNEVSWAGLKAYLPSKLMYPDITVIAIRARATNALSQQAARQFYVVHQRKLETWNPDTGWSVPTPTNSWAWAMAYLAKSPRWGRRTDRQIDLNALYRLDQSLAIRGDEFNQVVDKRQSVWTLFSESCRCVRAIPRAMLSTITWMRDAPGRPIRQIFTPYNIIRNSFSVDFMFFTDDSPDDVIFEYRDRDGWIERDVRAALPDSLAMEAARKRVLGITSRAQAYREACFEVACNSYRRTFLRFSTELEGRLLFRGDMVLVTHPLGGEGSSASVTGWNEAAIQVLLDTSLAVEEGAGSHYAVLRKPNGEPFGPVRVSGVGERSLTFDAASLAEVENKAATQAGEKYRPLWEWLSDGRRSAATSITFGREDPGLRAIILSVKPRQSGVCEIDAVVEDDRVHEADSDPVPPWTPSGEAPSIVTRPVIVGLSASYDFALATLTLSWTPSGVARSYQTQFRSYSSGYGWSEWNDLGESFEASRSFNVPQQMVEYRVRGLANDVAGFWVSGQADCSVSTMPTVVALALAAPYNAGTLYLGWPAADAQEITLVLYSAGIERMRKTVAGTATGATINAAEMQQYQGPWRELEVVAISRKSTWETRSPALRVVDIPPAQVQGLSVQDVGGGTIRLIWQATATSDNATGYIVVHNDPLGAVNIVAVQGASSTQLDMAVQPGKHTFIIAAKDALYDLNEDVYSLIFSDAIQIEVA